MTVLPAAFFGHGNPMNALERNRYTEAWRAFGRSVPRPRAILVISAHWYMQATAAGAINCRCCFWRCAVCFPCSRLIRYHTSTHGCLGGCTLLKHQHRQISITLLYPYWRWY